MSEQTRQFAKRFFGIEFPPYAEERNPEDFGLPPYPKGNVVGPCVCGSWPGGECLRCPVIPSKAQ